jgi:pimeloyl-ACP methyl ester carboxylesterase
MLAHDDTGTGTPVVFLHGLGSDRGRWVSIRRHLPDDVRCVCVDLPGHGDSPDEHADAVSAVGAVHELVDALGLDRPVVVGHSLGAIVTLLYASTLPTRAAIAVDPIGLHAPTLATSLAPYRDELLGGDTITAFHAFEEDHLLAGDPRAASIRGGLTPRADTIRSYWRGLLAAPEDVAGRQTRFAAAMASITAPTLVLLADSPSSEDADVLTKIRAASVEEWAGAGHWLHLADPQRFAQRLVSWLDAHGG